MITDSRDDPVFPRFVNASTYVACVTVSLLLLALPINGLSLPPVVAQHHAGRDNHIQTCRVTRQAFFCLSFLAMGLVGG